MLIYLDISKKSGTFAGKITNKGNNNTIKMQNRMKHSIITMVVLLLLVGCGKKTDSKGIPVQNGIYYWRTTFAVSYNEQAFLKKYEVKKLYLRLFDIDLVGDHPSYDAKPQPIATIQFPDSVNLKETMEMVDECVPTVFITLRGLNAMRFETDLYAEKLTTRILNMCSYHNLESKVKEVQLDCDWTESTEELYFELLKKVKDILDKHNIDLSATIRLHQLRSTVPPVDRGVLMLYNTGSFKHPNTENSIISYKDAAPYLKDMGYALPLDYALPTFAWGVWFRNNQFQAILHEKNYSDETLYEPIDNTHLLVLQDHICDGHRLKKGDMIRTEIADYESIKQVKELLPFAGNASIILYHLDENNLKNYSQYEKDSLYTRPCYN
jgi:hypothetical protein